MFKQFQFENRSRWCIPVLKTILNVTISFLIRQNYDEIDTGVTAVDLWTHYTMSPENDIR